MATTQTVRTHKKSSARPAKVGAQRRRVAKKSKPVMESQDQSAQTQTRARSTFTGTRIFDRSLHKTNIWLKEIMVAMDWKNREKALRAMRATLHSIRDVLPVQEIPQLASQFPIMIRGLYYENWKLLKQPMKMKSVGDFYELIRKKMGRGAVNFSADELRKFARICFQTISKHVSEGEMKDIKNALRKNLKGLLEESEIEAVAPAVQVKRGRKKASKRSVPVH